MTPISVVDAALLSTERPGSPMHVGGLAVIDGVISLAAFSERVAQLPKLLPRMAERVVGAAWVKNHRLDVKTHIFLHRLPGSGSWAELLDLTARIHEGQLDRARCLWEIHLIEGLEHERTAVVGKLHHCVVDGLSADRVASLLLDPTGRHEPSVRGLRKSDGGDRNTQKLTEMASGIASLALGVAASGPHRTSILAGAGRSLLNRPVGSRRMIVTAEVGFKSLRAARNHTGASSIDGLLCVIAGALRRLMGAGGHPTEHLTLRTVIPVSAWDGDESEPLGNRATGYFIDLPVGVRDPIVRLRKIAAANREARSSLQAEAIWNLIQIGVPLGNRVPPSLRSAVIHRVSGISRYRPANLIVSILPGPPGRRTLLGNELKGIYPLMPLNPHMALAVGVVTMNHSFHCCFTVDPDAVPSAGDLPDLMQVEANLLEELGRGRSASDWWGSEAG